MNVALWSTSFSPTLGGLERFSEQLAGWLAAEGHEVVVLTETTDVDGSDAHRPYRVLRGASRLTAFHAARRADVVQIAGLSLKGMLVAWAAGRRPFVTHQGQQAICPTGLAWTPTQSCTARDGPGPCSACPRTGVASRADVRLHHLASRTRAIAVFCSHFLRDRVGIPGAVIYNPVARDAFEPSSADAPTSSSEPVVAAAGRFVAEKGFDRLIRAMGTVPEARLLLAGDGPLRADLLSLAQHVGVDRRIEFTGRLGLAELRELYVAATVVCVPSLWDEPFGYAAAEAMALGKPVVATAVGAFTELLRDGRGYLASETTASAMAGALTDALSDPYEAAGRGAAARSFAESELHVDVTGKRYLELYARCAS